MVAAQVVQMLIQQVLLVLLEEKVVTHLVVLLVQDIQAVAALVIALMVQTQVQVLL